MNGIFVGYPTTDVKDKRLIFNSDKSTIKINVSAQPSHADYLKYTFGNNPACPATIGESNTVNLFEVFHNLNYRPAGLVYVYNYGLDSAYSDPGNYEIGSMGLAAAGQNEQRFAYNVDEKKLTIYYTVTRSALAPDATVTYDLTGYSFGFKYFIYSNRT